MATMLNPNAIPDGSITSSKIEPSVLTSISERVRYADVVDGLDSTETDKPLSANQGRVLADGKQDKLTAGDNITIVDNVISSTGGSGGSVDLSAYAKTEDVNAGLATKQDAISDLADIRSGASKGATALQSYTESDPMYLADKPKLALKVEIPDVSGKVDKVVGKGLSSNDYTDADKLKLTGLENYDDTQIRELIAGKANLQHQHTVADITDFPELYYDATTFFTSGAYPSDKYEELLEAVKAKKTVYATIDEEGYISYVFFMSSANSDGSSSRVLLTTIFADGGNLYLNTFVLQQLGMTPLQESITGKAAKATTLSGYGIGDAYTKGEVDAAIDGKQDKTSLVSDIATKVNALSSSDKAAFLGQIGAADKTAFETHNNDSTRHITAAERTAWNAKQDALTAGFGISISGGEISSTLDTNPFIVVSSLPSSGVKDKIYIAPSKNPETDNLTDEWIWNGSAWELLGASKVDLSDYATESWVENKGYLTEHQDISGKANVSDLTAHTGNKDIHVTASDKSAWNSKQDAISDLSTIRSGAALGATALQSYTEKYTGTITGITMNGASKGTSGVVNLGTVITEHQDISGKADKSSLAAVATSGSYNDLSNKPTIPSGQVNADWNATSGKAQILNKPTIPSAVTESTVSGWGFTKNTGTYSKPSTGIPKSDLESAVQTSLGKADTALQSYTEQYKGTITGVSANGTSVATSGVANIPAASTSVYGVTKLSSATNSTSTSLAATASAVKAAYDLANSYKGTVTGVKINGTTKNPSSGVVDLGTVITDISGKQDIISDLATIRSGAAKGATALQSYTETDPVYTADKPNIAQKIAIVTKTSGATSYAISPNKITQLGTLASSVTISLNTTEEETGFINIYDIIFTTPSAAPSITWPEGITWVGGSAPAIAGGKTYEVSIMNGLATYGEF